MMEVVPDLMATADTNIAHHGVVYENLVPMLELYRSTIGLFVLFDSLHPSHATAVLTTADLLNPTELKSP